MVQALSIHHSLIPLTLSLSCSLPTSFPLLIDCNFTTNSPFFSPTQPHPALSTLLPNAVPSHNSHKHSHPISPLPNLTILDAPIIIFPLPDPLYPFLPPSQLFSNLHQPHLPMLPPQFTPNILPFTSSSLPPSFTTLY